MVITRRPASVRRGFALAITLGFAAIAIVLAYGALQKSAPRLALVNKTLAAVKARNLAESATAIAAHYLIKPPSGVADCDYWTGTGETGLSIDGTEDYCLISVSRSTYDERLFTITGTGVAHDSSGRAAASRCVTAEVIRPPPDRWCLTRAFLGTASQAMPSQLNFNGDLHLNGSITASTAWSQSVVATTGTAVWLVGPPSAILTSQPPRLVPTVSATAWDSYSLAGANYTSTQWTENDLENKDWVCQGGIIKGSNPGGILVATDGSAGDRRLRVLSDVNFTGTLVVDGDLELDGSRITITAVEGYPALVVKKALTIKSTATNVIIKGPVLIGGRLRSGAGLILSRMNFQGGMVSNGDIGSGMLGSSLNITYDAAAASYHNFAGLADRQPFTIIKWTEDASFTPVAPDEGLIGGILDVLPL